MTSNLASPSGTRRVRVNVTCEGLLIALQEDGAVVQLPTALPRDRQTTLSIEDNDGLTVHIPARVVRSAAHEPPTVGRTEHFVAVEFLELSRGTAAAIRRIINDTARRTLLNLDALPLTYAPASTPA